MKRSSCASGRGYVPSCSIGFCVASTKKGSGSTCVVPAAVTACSCIACSSAAWVFGGARLISSASTMFANTGPCTNLKKRRPLEWSSSSSSVPVMSLGIKSGVNCTREKLRSSACATVCTSSVFARPGTPTSSTCPPASSAATRSSTILCCPTMRRPICSTSADRARASWSRSSTSRESSTACCRVATRIAPDCECREANESREANGGSAVTALRQHEVDALLDRIVRAVERRDRGVAAGLRLHLCRRPGLGHAHRVMCAELVILYALCEHAALRPAPDFAPRRIDDDEIVRLSAREIQFRVLVADVRDLQCEVHFTRGDGDVELRLKLDLWFGDVVAA